MDVQRKVTSTAMDRILNGFETLRLLDREVPGQLVSAFLYVASHNPCHKIAMEQALGLTSASASRTISWMSANHRLGKPGLDLVVKYEDPFDARRFMVKLSPHGERLANKILTTIYDSNHELGSSS